MPSLHLKQMKNCTLCISFLEVTRSITIPKTNFLYQYHTFDNPKSTKSIDSVILLHQFAHGALISFTTLQSYPLHKIHAQVSSNFNPLTSMEAKTAF
jgi:hypothetical protein